MTSIAVPPECDPGHVYHLFPVLVDDAYVARSFSSAPENRASARDAFQTHLASHGIGTLVHYPIALTRQQAFADLQSPPCPVAERVASQVCSLPLHPQLRDEHVDEVARAVLAWTYRQLLASALLIAYLPGALFYRLPMLGRDQRAALDAGERVFWHVQISVAWSLAIVLALAAVGEYRYDRLLVTNGISCLLLVVIGRGSLLYHGVATRPSWRVALPLALIAFGIVHFFPSSEYVIGGKDPGTYVNQGIQIAQRGAMVVRDPDVAELPPVHREFFFPLHEAFEDDALRFMGFFIVSLARGEVVGQFPHLFPASIAVGYGLNGLTGARQAVGWWSIVALLGVYYLAARLAGPLAAFAAALLLALHPIVIWFSRYPNAEIVMAAMGFAALLALARSQQDGVRGLGLVGGALMGLMLFLKIDTVLMIAAVLAAIVLAAIADRRPIPRGFVVGLIVVGIPAWRYLATTMWPYSVQLTNLLSMVPGVAKIGGALAAVAVLAVLFRFRDHYGSRVRQALPIVLIVLIVAAAAYAWWFRVPGPVGARGSLTDYDAYAFRTIGLLYLTPLGVVLALAGFVLVARRDLWRDPAFLLTFAGFSLFLFYKIEDCAGALLDGAPVSHAHRARRAAPRRGGGARAPRSASTMADCARCRRHPGAPGSWPTIPDCRDAAGPSRGVRRHHPRARAAGWAIRRPRSGDRREP